MTIAKNVLRGAEWLDKELPGWEDKIDLNKLRLADPCRCILGQLFKNEALQTRKGSPPFIWATIQILKPRGISAGKYGFTISDHCMVWGELDKEWRTQIEKRRADKGTMI